MLGLGLRPRAGCAFVGMKMGELGGASTADVGVGHRLSDGSEVERVP